MTKNEFLQHFFYLTSEVAVHLIDIVEPVIWKILIPIQK